MQTLKILTSKVGFILSFCLLFNFAEGQLCTGTLGDPVVNFDFGRGTSDVGPQLKNTLPNLRYSPAACNPDGQYTIRKSLPTSCFGSWHILTEDHTTTDTDGYMMVLNATNAPGDFYIDTIKGVCGDNVYEFAAWVVNLQKIGAFPNPSYPNLEFRIETINGTLLASNKTGSIPETASPVWKQYGLFFKTPPGSQTLVLRIYNGAPAGFGNDFALDDITFRPCGPTLSVSLPGFPGNSIDECFGKINQVAVQANLGTGYSNPAIVWQQSVDSGKTFTDIPGSSGLNYNFNITGPSNYRIRATVSEATNIGSVECRVVSNTVTVNIRELAGNGAKVNSPICTNGVIQFEGGDGTSFTWTGPNGFVSNQRNPVLPATLDRTGTYYLDATSSFGCAGKDTLFVQVNDQPLASATSPFSICSGDTIQLQASGGLVYKWLPATGLSSDTISNPVAFPTTSTNYSVVVSNNNGCTDTVAVVVNVAQTPTANAGPDQVMLAGQSITLLGQATGTNTTILWTPSTSLSNPNVINPVASPSLDIVYTLTVSSDDGCGEATDDVFVKVFAGLKIPNAFSPNGDGINDGWRIDALAVYPNNETTIFDRYGREVFKSKGGAVVWDGTRNGIPVPVGVYYYYIDLKKDGDPPLKGSVAVIR